MVSDGGPPDTTADVGTGDAGPECTMASECTLDSALTACVAGQCVIESCAEGFADCDVSPMNGCEQALGTPANCAGCGAACLGGQFCETDGTNRTCVEMCSGLECGDHCVASPATNPMFCGECDVRCARPQNAFEATCAAEICGFTCSAGFGDCDVVDGAADMDGCETSTDTDVNHCGACGDPCELGANASTMACANGMCEVASCNEGFVDCDAELDCEVEADTDPNNCGACGVICEAGATCVNGRCDPYVEVAAGRYHACGRRSSGEVYCWGDNESRQLGGDLPRPAESPLPLRWSPDDGAEVTVLAADISAGEAYTCFISAHAGATEGNVYCLGSNGTNRLGRPGSSNDVAEISFSDGVMLPSDDFAFVESGLFHSCAVTTAGELYCWGNGGSGQTGLAPPETITSRFAHPVSLPGPAPGNAVVSVAIGFDHTCVATQAGGVYCFGENSVGQLGSAASAATATPRLVLRGEDPIENAEEVFATFRSTCMRTAVGELLCWGSNVNDSLADSGAFFDEPVLVATNVQVAWVPFLGTCWVDSAGVTQCRGRNFEGQFGTGLINDPITSARPIPALDGMESGRGSFEYSCGFRAGELLCWGYSDSGEIPRTSLLEESAAPIRNDAGDVITDFDTVSLGSQHACGVRSGQVFCWGINQSRQLGISAQFPASAPRAVPGLTQVVDLASSSLGGCARAEERLTPAIDGVYCWGRQGTPGSSPIAFSTLSSPTRVAGLPAAQAIDYGGVHACAIGDDSVVSCWGSNSLGQIGVAPEDRVLTPTQVDIDGTSLLATELALGNNFSCALEAGRTLVCWGLASNGQLGIGGAGGTELPTRLSLTGVTAVSAGAVHTCAVADGNAYCWGSNEHGQLGVSGTNQLTPALLARPEVGGVLVAAEDVAVDARTSCFSYEDGLVRCVGDNAFFQQGIPMRATTVGDPVRGVSEVTELEAFDSGFCAKTASDWRCWGHNVAGRFSTGPDVAAAPTEVAR